MSVYLFVWYVQVHMYVLRRVSTTLEDLLRVIDFHETFTDLQPFEFLKTASNDIQNVKNCLKVYTNA